MTRRCTAPPNAFPEASMYDWIGDEDCLWTYVAEIYTKVTPCGVPEGFHPRWSCYNCWIKNFAQTITGQVGRIVLPSKNISVRFVARLVGSSFTLTQRRPTFGSPRSPNVLIDSFPPSLKLRLTSRSSWGIPWSNAGWSALHLRQLHPCFVKSRINCCCDSIAFLRLFDPVSPSSTYKLL